MTTRRVGPPIAVTAAKCAGCLTCVLRCSLRFEKAFRPAAAAIRVCRLVGEAEEFAISFTELCDNCGICARYCPYGTLVQENKKGTGSPR